MRCPLPQGRRGSPRDVCPVLRVSEAMSWGDTAFGQDTAAGFRGDGPASLSPNVDLLCENRGHAL